MTNKNTGILSLIWTLHSVYMYQIIIQHTTSVHNCIVQETLGIYRSVVPKRPPLRKNRECSRCRAQHCSVVLHSFSPQHCPTSAKDTQPFNKSKFSTLSLQLSIHFFTLFFFFWAPFDFWEADFTKLRANTEQITQFKHNYDNHGTDSFSASTSCVPHTQKKLSFCFWNFFWFCLFIFTTHLLKPTM
jgi:hypothetical protein